MKITFYYKSLLFNITIDKGKKQMKLKKINFNTDLNTQIH